MTSSKQVTNSLLMLHSKTLIWSAVNCSRSSKLHKPTIPMRSGPEEERRESMFSTAPRSSAEADVFCTPGCVVGGGIAAGGNV